MTHFGDYSREIYAKGMLAGEKPAWPVAFAELERAAEAALPETSVAYVFGSAGTEDTLRENLAAFRRWRIVPRMLRDVSRRDLRTTVLGSELRAPVMVAPIGVQSIVHADGELATARAAGAVGVPMAVGTVSSNSMEDVAKALGDTPRWFQLYWPNDPDLAASFVRRAEAAGYGAIVVTVDNVMPGWKPRDLQQANHPALNGHGIANYLTDEVFLAGLGKSPEQDPIAARLRFLQVFINPTLTWDDLGWLRERTELPILLKGILHPDDARRAAQCGINGVVVSNHGARQVDGAIAALDALPEIVEAVGDELTVLMDSGIRSGSDVVKALALGARAVLVGRPCLWGLAVGGQAGVEHVLRALLAEVDLTMALSGFTSPAELGVGVLRRV